MEELRITDKRAPRDVWSPERQGRAELTRTIVYAAETAETYDAVAQQLQKFLTGAVKNWQVTPADLTVSFDRLSMRYNITFLGTVVYLNDEDLQLSMGSGGGDEFAAWINRAARALLDGRAVALEQVGLHVMKTRISADDEFEVFTRLLLQFPPERPTLIVVGGKHTVFLAWLQRHGTLDHKRFLEPVMRPEQMRGHRGKRVLWWPSWNVGMFESEASLMREEAYVLELTSKDNF